MQRLKQEIAQELEEHILPFWMSLKDDKHGGFYGKVDVDLNKDIYGEKGGIALARILWTFSAAYRVLGNPVYLEHAAHAYQFLIEKCYDPKYKGIYWMLDYKGNPADTRKHVYAQSFAIYGLSEYYRASKNKAALDLALEIYQLIEAKGFNVSNQAYLEEFDRKWNPSSNEMLSENGVTADITMNTHIHILEAYTNLYKALPLEALKAKLESLLYIHYQKIYNQETKFLEVFFDQEWKPLLPLKSFGHDIEASWLMDETIKTLQMEKEPYHQMVLDIAYNIAGYAVQPDGSLINEEEGTELDYTRIWWVQAEAMVGFYNAYERTGDKLFLNIVQNQWNYMKQYLIDKRQGGEWYWSVDQQGKPASRPIAEPWKVSYHNSRFCLEFIERMEAK